MQPFENYPSEETGHVTGGATALALALALCDAADGSSRASCAVELDRKAPDWIQIMPAGDLRPAAFDGRAPWRLADARAVIEKSASRGIDLVVDYEHQTDNAPNNGQPAPAAGWIKELAERAGAIWGRVEWTDRARAMIEAGEYRYLSPTFLHDKARTVQQILRAALTNNPALNMKALATSEDFMDKFLKALLAALNMPEGDEDAVTAKVKALAAAHAAQAAQLASFAKALAVAEDAGEDAIATAVAGLAKAAATPDPKKFVPIDKYAALETAVATLQSGAAADKARAAVTAAMQAGKITPAQEEWALDLATSSPEKFEAFVAAAVVVVTPGDSGAGATAKGGPATLTDSDIAVCKAMGIDPEVFKKTREQELAR